MPRTDAKFILKKVGHAVSYNLFGTGDVARGHLTTCAEPVEASPRRAATSDCPVLYCFTVPSGNQAPETTDGVCGCNTLNVCLVTLYIRIYFIFNIVFTFFLNLIHELISNFYHFVNHKSGFFENHNAYT